MLKLASILLLAHFVAGKQVININNYTDPQILQINEFLTKAGFGLRKLPDVSYPEVQLSNGFQVGVNSLVRVGDAFLTNYDNKTQSVDIHIGYKLFVLAYGSIKFDNVDISGTYRVHNNSFHVSYNVTTDPNCKVVLNDYQFDVLTDVFFESSIPEYGGDLSEAFTNHALPRVNEKLSYLRPKVEKTLQQLLCHQHKGNSQLSGHHVTNVLSSLINIH